jgi:hypothetical protein
MWYRTSKLVSPHGQAISRQTFAFAGLLHRFKRHRF